MEKNLWSFTPKLDPARTIPIEFTHAVTNTGDIAFALLTSFMQRYYGDTEASDVPIEGVMKNHQNGDLWEVTAKGATVIEYSHEISNISMQITFPDPIDPGLHTDQMQIDEAIKAKPGLTENREFHEALGLKTGGE